MAGGLVAEVKQFKLVIASSHDSIEQINDTASEVGAGVIGAYSRCAYVSEGRGNYVGDETTSPTNRAPGRHPGCMSLRDRLQATVPDVEWLLFTPTPGLNGRPF